MSTLLGCQHWDFHPFEVVAAGRGCDSPFLDHSTNPPLSTHPFPFTLHLPRPPPSYLPPAPALPAPTTRFLFQSGFAEKPLKE